LLGGLVDLCLEKLKALETPLKLDLSHVLGFWGEVLANSEHFRDWLGNSDWVVDHGGRDDVHNTDLCPVLLKRHSHRSVLVIDQKQFLGASDGHVQEFKLSAHLGELAIDFGELCLQVENSRDLGVTFYPGSCIVVFQLLFRFSWFLFDLSLLTIKHLEVQELWRWCFLHDCLLSEDLIQKLPLATTLIVIEEVIEDNLIELQSLRLVHGQA
jgi:hypothetical protein